jgi:hypothetical protein
MSLDKFAKGRFTCTQPEKYVGSKVPTYRSSWEWSFMNMCDTHPNITNWASESVKIPYKDPLTGRQTVYVPDFLIQYEDKHGKKRTELIEIKPANQMIKERVGKNAYNQAQFVKNQAKWTAANAWCRQNGIIFRVINEGDIFHNGKKK